MRIPTKNFGTVFMKNLFKMKNCFEFNVNVSLFTLHSQKPLQIMQNFYYMNNLLENAVLKLNR